jgi:hypothetical protein
MKTKERDEKIAERVRAAVLSTRHVISHDHIILFAELHDRIKNALLENEEK